MTGEIAELVTAAQSGDRSAFDELVRVTYRETYTLALRLTNNAEDAADVTQEAYLRAYRSLSRFRGDSQFNTWLYRITANCASTQLTKRSKHRHEELDVESSVVESRESSQQVDAILESSELSVALAALPASLRSVVVLRDIYDLSHSAIADELGISEVTAKVRLHRARKKLRDAVVKERSGEQDQHAV